MLSEKQTKTNKNKQKTKTSKKQTTTNSINESRPWYGNGAYA